MIYSLRLTMSFGGTNECSEINLRYNAFPVRRPVTGSLLTALTDLLLSYGIGTIAMDLEVIRGISILFCSRMMNVMPSCSWKWQVLNPT